MMAFQFQEGEGEEAAPLSEINVIPLVDVMLVLLVIFIITAPLLTHSVKIDLPRAASAPNVARTENIQLGVNEAGKLFWNGEPVDRPELRRRLAASSRLEPQPELHIRADRVTQYQRIAEVLSDAATAGLSRIGFVTDPAMR
jgi:biopolymer transport protein ExbD